MDSTGACSNVWDGGRSGLFGGRRWDETEPRYCPTTEAGVNSHKQRLDKACTRSDSLLFRHRHLPSTPPQRHLSQYGEHLLHAIGLILTPHIVCRRLL